MEELRKQYEFVYRETKQDTGRTTDDGYIIWGQKFVGAITAGANAGNDRDLITGLPGAAKVIDSSGGWSSPYWMSLGGAWGTEYLSVIAIVNGAMKLSTKAAAARTNAPYEVYVDWTDGTVR